MSTQIIGIIVGLISIFCVMGFGLAGGIYFYNHFESKNRTHKTLKEESNKKIHKKIPTGLRQSDIGEGIKQTKVSITNTTNSINVKKARK